MPRPTNTYERIKSKILKSNDGCWLWDGYIHKVTGYGRLSVNWKDKLAHRYVYESLVGKIPEGLQLDHLCSVRHCVNPTHLEPVLAKENIRRGRQTKLTADDVTAIRKSYKNPYTQRQLAEKYSVYSSTISRIVSNKRWA